MACPSLYSECLNKTVWLLKNSYWHEVYEQDGSRSNPFTGLPPHIINDLFLRVIQASTAGSALKVTDLYHLLTSGRVEHFTLNDLLLPSEEFISILMSLSVACQNLRSFTLRNVFFSEPYPHLKKTKDYMKRAAVECVLNISPLLESVESCVEFDLKSVRNCDRLRVLKLNFVSKVPVCDFLEFDDGHFWPNNSLTILDVFEDTRHHVNYLDTVSILKYCPNLREINTDVSRVLEFLHADELYRGTLSAQYNLQKCCLGSIHHTSGSATLTSVHIATLTCPQLKEVDVLANDQEAIFALTDFPCLSSLLIQWDSPVGCDFQLGVQLLLDKCGAGLKDFHLLNFFNVDFGLIASKCPNLEKLKLEFLSESWGYDSPKECFKCLKSLYVENVEDKYGYRENTLTMLLSNCCDLENMSLHSVACLSDALLSDILCKNNLSKVKEAAIVDSSLSEVGIRNLITHLKTLEQLEFSSSLILFDAAVVIVHEINPRVMMIQPVEV